MTEQKVFEQVRKIVADQLCATASELISDTSFDELGADSLSLVELMMELEEQLGVVIPDEECEKLKTIGQVVDYIVEKKTRG